MPYPRGVVERAMKVQEVIVRALAGKLTWRQAADILGRSPRSIRRLRWKLEHEGYEGLFDRRRQTPSPKRAPVAEVQRGLALYRERYQGFNVRHFHQLARRHHDVRFCYAFVKKALQMAGLVPPHQPRGRHRRRREPRPCYGELLHLDGSRHLWLALTPDPWSARLGIQHLPGSSPRAGGRSERVTRTLQDRLVNELGVAGITTVAAANRYLRDQFLPAFNTELGRPPAEATPAFVPLGRVDLDQILCVEADRVVGRDNVVTADGVPLQVAKQPGRRTCAGLRVLVRRHLNGHHSLWYGTRCLGRYDDRGRPLRAA